MAKPIYGMTDFDDLWKRTILSQYGNSEAIKTVIKGFAELMDPNFVSERTVRDGLNEDGTDLRPRKVKESDFSLFYKYIFNPETCEGIGTKIWARIVAMANQNGIDVAQGEYFGYDTPRNFEQVYPVGDERPVELGWYERKKKGEHDFYYFFSRDTAVISGKEYFKESEMGREDKINPFDQRPYWHDAPGSGRFQFTSASLRTLVMAKALANITNSSLPTLKEFLKQILGSNQFSVDNLENTAGTGGFVYQPVTPTGDENPKQQGWYEKIDDEYVLTQDTEVVAGKQYYKELSVEMAVKFVITGTRPVTLELFKIYAPKVVGAGVKILYQATASTFFGFQGMTEASPFRGLTNVYQLIKPIGTESPSQLGWYELVDGEYVETRDASIVADKKYYLAIKGEGGSFFEEAKANWYYGEI